MSDSEGAGVSEITETPRPRRGRIALFDLRWILAFLFGVYGIVVTLTGLLVHAKTYTASGQDVHVNVNLWTGIPMLVLAALFALWAGLRPTVVPVSTTARDDAG